MRRIAVLFLFLFVALLFAESEFSQYANEEYWLGKVKYPPLTKEALEQAIELGRSYFLNHQKNDGNFIYMLDLQNGDIVQKDNAVRQAYPR